MAELVKEYFKRDLSEREAARLGELIQDEAQAAAFALLPFLASLSLPLDWDFESADSAAAFESPAGAVSSPLPSALRR